MSDDIIKEGWLKKEGGKRMIWNERWFVLTKSKLTYAKSKEEMKEKLGDPSLDFVDLSTILQIQPPHDYRNSNTPVLGLGTQERTYYLTFCRNLGGSQADLVEWETAIRGAVAQLQDKKPKKETLVPVKAVIREEQTMSSPRDRERGLSSPERVKRVEIVEPIIESTANSNSKTTTTTPVPVPTIPIVETEKLSLRESQDGGLSPRILGRVAESRQVKRAHGEPQRRPSVTDLLGHFNQNEQTPQSSATGSETSGVSLNSSTSVPNYEVVKAADSPSSERSNTTSSIELDASKGVEHFESPRLNRQGRFVRENSAGQTRERGNSTPINRERLNSGNNNNNANLNATSNANPSPTPDSPLASPQALNRENSTPPPTALTAPRENRFQLGLKSSRDNNATLASPKETSSLKDSSEIPVPSTTVTAPNSGTAAPTQPSGHAGLTTSQSNVPSLSFHRGATPTQEQDGEPGDGTERTAKTPRARQFIPSPRLPPTPHNPPNPEPPKSLPEKQPKETPPSSNVNTNSPSASNTGALPTVPIKVIGSQQPSTTAPSSSTEAKVSPRPTTPCPSTPPPSLTTSSASGKEGHTKSPRGDSKGKDKRKDKRDKEKEKEESKKAAASSASASTSASNTPTSTQPASPSPTPTSPRERVKGKTTGILKYRSLKGTKDEKDKIDKESKKKREEKDAETHDKESKKKDKHAKDRPKEDANPPPTMSALLQESNRASDQSSSEDEPVTPQQPPIQPQIQLTPSQPVQQQQVQPLPNNPFFANINNVPNNIPNGSDFLSPRVARVRGDSGAGHGFNPNNANHNQGALPFPQVPLIPDYVLPTAFPDLLNHPIQRFEPAQLQRDLPHLAKGSFGIVYTGHVRHVTDAKVVIKDMSVQGEKSVEEWKKELITMSVNACPYICQVFGYTHERKTLTIVMEFMQNGDLFSILEDPVRHPLSSLQKLRMSRHIALGINQLHSNGMIHRDIKSMNVLVTEDYSCKLADFGTAKLNDNSTFMNTMNAGTPLWMAPEVKSGMYNFTADIYSYGIVLYELFEGPLLPHWNQQTQTLTLPLPFKSSSLVMPCVNRDATARPTAKQISQHLDFLTNKFCMAYMNSMSQLEKQQLKQAALSVSPPDQKDDENVKKIEVSIAYRHLLKQPPQFIDSILTNCFI